MSSWKKGWIAVVACALGAISCTNDPENFCAAQVDQICTVLADCCNADTEFDPQACELQVSSSCETALQVEGVHAGDYVFDEGSAAVCYGTLASCDDATGQEATPERIRACGNMLTGHRPSGAACTESAQCEKAGEYPVCHGGKVCAKGILSESDCGFSFETLELRVCMGDTYCDVKDVAYDPGESPTKQELEFSGTCKSYVAKGKKCFADDEFLPCKSGLFCQYDPVAPEESTCEALKGKNEPCTGADCKEGLVCDFNGVDGVCIEAATQGFFCYTPPKCGNGFCEDPYEDLDGCPQDCAFCGDGTCSAGEETECATDCGGTAGCGDGTCDFNGTEPATCPADCCGDGFCDPGEDAVCPTDCGT